MKARIIGQEAGAQNGPPGAAHRALKIKIKKIGTIGMEQQTKVTRLLTRVVGSGQPTEADQGPAKDVGLICRPNPSYWQTGLSAQS